MYPGCPKDWRQGLLLRTRQRGMYGRLGEIAGLLVSNSIRHQVTSYEHLLQLGGADLGDTPRQAARKIVARDVEDLAVSWRVGSAENDPGYIELRDECRRLWREAPEGTPVLDLIAAENAAIAQYLEEWAVGREVHQVSPGDRPAATLVLKWSKASSQTSA
ncbi:DUF2293 domain-containing protein [Aureimonas sp. D3]|uniref:DUF2293 domain-containing protein n=1 Tax=Aureimonas sp. D3 TaxID=1638164 RepID=UPI0035B569CE